MTSKTPESKYSLPRIIFVYGTLRRLGSNHFLLDNKTTEYLGKFRTKEKFVMVGRGIPAVIEHSVSPCSVPLPIRGEAYLVQESHVLHDLDSLESEGDFYLRKPVSLVSDPEKYAIAKAEIYFGNPKYWYNDETSGSLINSLKGDSYYEYT